MDIVGATQIVLDLCAEVGPAAYLDKTEDGDNGGSHPNKDELENLVEDCRAKPAERYIESDSNRGDPDGEVQVPAQDDLHDQRHRIHVDAAHEHGHEGKADGGKRACGVAIAQMQVSGDRVGFRDVVEGHHHDAE